jgi:hypothetical protein
VAGAGWFAGILARRESLATSLAVCGLKARIRAARLYHPELLADPDAAAVLRAVEADRQGEAVRMFRTLMRERGPEHAFALLGPCFAEILAWHALTDDNPFNDHAGWQVATGRARTAEPLLGVGAAVRAFFDRGAGTGPVPAAERPEAPGPYLAPYPVGAAVARGRRGGTPDPVATRLCPLGRHPRLRAPVPPPPAPAPRPAARPVYGLNPPYPKRLLSGGGLRAHSVALHGHARRLRAAAEELGPSALRAEVVTLAARCTCAANALALAAAQLREDGRAF